MMSCGDIGGGSHPAGAWKNPCSTNQRLASQRVKLIFTPDQHDSRRPDNATLKVLSRARTLPEFLPSLGRKPVPKESFA